MNSERYTDGRTRINVDGQLVFAKHCSRDRCTHVIVLQSDIDDIEELTKEELRERSWRYPYYAIVVSMDGGTQKKVYCSIDCASIELNRMRQHTKRK